MRPIWIERAATRTRIAAMRAAVSATVIVMTAVATLAGCASSKDDLLPHGDATMQDVWNRETAGNAAGNQTARQLLDARLSLRRPLTEADTVAASTVQAAYSRTAEREIANQFARLPNPDLVMYVFAHLSGADPVPVPGYTTVFPLYQRVQYAMPGERTQEY